MISHTPGFIKKKNTTPRITGRLAASAVPVNLIDCKNSVSSQRESDPSPRPVTNRTAEMRMICSAPAASTANGLSPTPPNRSPASAVSYDGIATAIMGPTMNATTSVRARGPSR